MFGQQRQGKQWGVEEVAPLIEMTEPPDNSARSSKSNSNSVVDDPLSQQQDDDDDECEHDNEENHHSDYEDGDGDDESCSTSNSASGNPFDDDSLDDVEADEYEPWDDRDPESYQVSSPDAIYTCPPQYGTYLLPCVALVFLFLLSELAHAIVRDVGYNGGDRKVKDDRQHLVVLYFFLNWIALLAIGLTLPRKLEILSDSSVAVGTTFTRWKFCEIRSAQRNSLYCDTVKRLRWDFATDCASRVVIKRTGKKWEVALSPKDPDEFVEVLRSMCNGSTAENTV